MYNKISINIPDLQKGFFWARCSSSRETRLRLKSFLYLGHRIFGALPILCIMVLENIYRSEHFLNQSVLLQTQDSRTEDLMSLNEVSIEWKGNEFERFGVFNIMKLKNKENFFYFHSAFIIVIQFFKERFLRVFSS